MFEYELHQMRSAELRRRAEEERQARAARRHRRAARRTAGQEPTEARSHTDRTRRHRFTHAA